MLGCRDVEMNVAWCQTSVRLLGDYLRRVAWFLPQCDKKGLNNKAFRIITQIYFFARPHHDAFIFGGK